MSNVIGWKITLQSPDCGVKIVGFTLKWNQKIVLRPDCTWNPTASLKLAQRTSFKTFWAWKQKPEKKIAKVSGIKLIVFWKLCAQTMMCFLRYLQHHCLLAATNRTHWNEAAGELSVVSFTCSLTWKCFCNSESDKWTGWLLVHSDMEAALSLATCS